MGRKIYVPTNTLSELLYKCDVAVYKDGNINRESYVVEEDVYDYEPYVRDGISSSSIERIYTFDNFNFSINYTEFSDIDWGNEIHENEVKLSKNDINKLIEEGNIFIFKSNNKDKSIEDLVWENDFYVLDEINNIDMISREELLRFLLSKYNLTEKQAREMYVDEVK